MFSSATSAPALPPLTSLRFIAAMLVLISHGILMSGLQEIPLFGALRHISGPGMTLFFTLSGFVIHYNYKATVLSGWHGIGRFAWARFARLYPLFIAFLAADFFLGLEIVRAAAGNENRLGSMLSALPYYLTLTQSWFYYWRPDRTIIFEFGPSITVGWSISTEWFFYCAYPLIAICIARLRSLRTAIISAIIFTLVWAAIWARIGRSFQLEVWAVGQWGETASHPAYSFKHWLTYFSPYSQIGSFIVGCLTAQIYDIAREATSISGNRMRLNLALAAVLLALIPVYAFGYFAFLETRFFAAIVPNIGMAPCMAVLIFCASIPNTWAHRLLSWRPLITGGDASYSLYLVHPIALGVVFNLRYTQYQDRLLGAVVTEVQFVAAAVLAVVLALGLYRTIEDPARRWLRRIGMPWFSAVDHHSRKLNVDEIAVANSAEALHQGVDIGPARSR